MWEKAIELGKQLARMHESHMFDFMELSELLVRGHAHSSQRLSETARRHLSTFAVTASGLLPQSDPALIPLLLCPPAEKASSVL